MFWCITSVFVLRIGVTVIIHMRWLGIVSLLIVTVWFSNLRVISWPVLTIIVIRSLIIWSVVWIIFRFVVLVSLILAIWVAYIPIVGIISVSIVRWVSRSIIWIVSFSGVWAWIVFLILIVLTIWSTKSTLWEVSCFYLFWRSTSINRVIGWLVSWTVWIIWKWFSRTIVSMNVFIW